MSAIIITIKTIIILFMMTINIIINTIIIITYIIMIIKLPNRRVNRTQSFHSDLQTSLLTIQKSSRLHHDDDGDGEDDGDGDGEDDGDGDGIVGAGTLRTRFEKK